MMKKRWGLPFGPVQSGSQTNTAPPLDLPPIITPADAKQFGFENFGNTCYANSVLQALYFCGPFRELVIQYPDPSVPELSTHPPPPVQQTPTPLSPRPKPTRKMSVSDSPHVSSPVQRPTPAPPSASIPGSIPIPPAPPTLLSALRSLYVHISKNPADRGTVSPKAFMDKLKEMNELFRGTQHQDAHEFLNVLLNTIVEEMETDRRNGAGEDLSQSIATLSSNAPTTNGSTNESHRPLVGTLVHRLFEGVLTSETRCLTCETVSSRDESFLDLSIDIEQNSSVTACLRQFSASEMLCQKNKFFCDSCCDLQEAEKRMKIKKLPNVLALHLKRFKYQEDTGRYIKLTYRVAFPYHLRLFNTVDDAEDPDRLYELFAIVVHIGAGPHHGHYVSIINTRDMWLLFDDDTVEVIKESDIPRYFGDSGSNNGSAYVLYYQAVDVDVAALGVKIVQPPSSGASGVTTTHENGTAPSSISFLAKADQVPPDVLTDSLQSLEPDHIVPTLPPGLSVEPPSPTPFDSSVPTFTTPSYTATSSTLSTPGASTTGLTPLVIPNGNSSSSSSSGSGSGVGLGLAVPTGDALPESATSTPTSTSPPQAGASTLGSIMNSLTLKHVSSSVRVKNGSGRKDEGALPPMPASPVASTSSSAGLGGKPRSSTTRPHSPTTESVESSAYSHVNGKEKDREEKEREKEKSIKWFPRRKSFRNSRPSTSAGPATAPPLPPPPSAFNTFPTSEEPQHGLSTSATGPHQHQTWFNRKLGRRASEAAIQEPFLATSLPASPTPLHNYSSASPHLQSVAESRNSQPDQVARSKSNKLPARPSTAGAEVNGRSRRPKSAISPPLPPLPGSPTSSSQFSRIPNGQYPPLPLGSPTVASSHNGSSSPLPTPSQGLVPPVRPPRAPRPHSSAGGHSTPPPVSFSHSAAADSPTAPLLSGNGNGANGKRTSRKLSFTAPMLGFGRSKNKDK